jgi:hypothetical protein
MNRVLLALPVTLLLSVPARADESSLFKFYRDSGHIPPPCQLLGPAVPLVGADGIWNLVYTCTDGKVIIRTDDTRNPNIHLWLDWPMGNFDRTAQGNLLAGSGWAFECGGHAIVQYRVTIGPMTFDNVAGWGGIRRPDVAVAFPRLCQAEAGESGLGFSVDVGALAAGTYPLTLLVMDDQGKWAESNSLRITVK